MNRISPRAQTNRLRYKIKSEHYSPHARYRLQF